MPPSRQPGPPAPGGSGRLYPITPQAHHPERSARSRRGPHRGAPFRQGGPAAQVRGSTRPPPSSGAGPGSPADRERWRRSPSQASSLFWPLTRSCSTGPIAATSSVGREFRGPVRCVGPQPFQAIELTPLGVEDVDDNVAVVEQHPLAPCPLLRGAAAGRRRRAAGAQPLPRCCSPDGRWRRCR